MSIQKLSRMLLAINILLFLFGVTVLIGLHVRIIVYSEPLVDFAVSMILLCSLLEAVGLLSVTQYQDRTYQESMEDLEQMNLKMREQRHDYMNQIQIVYGLLELGEYKEARNYLRPVFQDIKKMNNALRTSKPAVNALLQAKIDAAQQQGISVYLEVTTQLVGLPLEPWEFCKILANLIDNAVTAVSGLEEEKKLWLRLDESKESFRFLIRNNGPAIPKEQQKLIFHQGYTTKKGENHGMGLTIVSRVLKECGGHISFVSDENGTVFSVDIQKGQSVAKGGSAKNDNWREKMYDWGRSSSLFSKKK